MTQVPSSEALKIATLKGSPSFSPARTPYQTTRLTSLQGTKNRFNQALDEELLDGWRSLVDSGPHAQPFYQPEWFKAFADSFAAGREVQLLTVRNGASLLGVLPLMRTNSFFGRIPARVLTGLSGIHSCRYDLITGGQVHGDLASAAWQVLIEDQSWDVLEAQDVPERGSFIGIVECARRSGYLVGSWPTRKSPILTIPSSARTGGDPFQNCPSRFRTLRKRLSSKLKTLHQRGTVSFSVEDSNLEEGLARFFALESSGWKGANGSAIASDVQTTAFYSSIAKSFKERGQLRIYSMCLDNRPISMQLGLLMDGVYYSPKVAYDEAFASYSPGHLLVQHIISDLAANNVRTFEFLGPRAFWKMVWAPECVEHRNWYIFRPNLRGHVLYSLTMRVAPRLRSLRHRVWGDPQEH
ncbi:MAG: GNAT family N-acetyltransferase [Pseudomonadota bacterium]|jgi:CelD/BcsL family acetyltransferase involved in cellulose biosynthesis